MTQNEQILNHLKEHKTINPMQALNKYRCFRLASRISDLRKDHVINTNMVSTEDEEGKRVCYAEYEYVKERNNGRD